MRNMDNNLKKIDRCAAYVRVSSQEQKLHGLSLDAQKMKIKEYADKHNLRIVEWYLDEGVSGRKKISNRPELQRMIQEAEKGNFERILFIKLDRFFRSVAEYHECMKRIEPVKWTATEEEYDLTTANGRLLVNMKLTIAELEADQTGERIRIVNDYKIKKGTPVTGVWGFAFKIIKDENGNKKLVRNPEVEQMVYDYLDYFETHQNLHKSYNYIINKYDFHPSSTQLKRLLKNKLLYGEYRSNPNYCQPYITRERFDRIQDILSRNVKNNTRKKVYLFTGLIRCPECGCVLSGTTNSQKARGNGRTHYYKKYICKKHFIEKKCGFKKLISENVFERLMMERIESELDRVKNEKDLITNTAHIKDNSDKIMAEIERLNYSWQKGRISPEEYDKQYEELYSLLNDMKKITSKMVDFSAIHEVLSSGWKDTYKSLSDENKRAFWRSIVKEIHVTWDNDVKDISEIKFF